LNDAQHNSEDVAGIAVDDYSGPKSSLDIYLSFKDMKDNNNEWTLEVGDKIKKYRVTFDPEDNLSDIKQVSRGNLIKRVDSEEDIVKPNGEKNSLGTIAIEATWQHAPN